MGSWVSPLPRWSNRHSIRRIDVEVWISVWYNLSRSLNHSRVYRPQWSCGGGRLNDGVWATRQIKWFLQQKQLLTSMRLFTCLLRLCCWYWRTNPNTQNCLLSLPQVQQMDWRAASCPKNERYGLNLRAYDLLHWPTRSQIDGLYVGETTQPILTWRRWWANEDYLEWETLRTL